LPPLSCGFIPIIFSLACSHYSNFRPLQPFLHPRLSITPLDTHLAVYGHSFFFLYSPPLCVCCVYKFLESSAIPFLESSLFFFEIFLFFPLSFPLKPRTSPSNCSMQTPITLIPVSTQRVAYFFSTSHPENPLRFSPEGNTDIIGIRVTLLYIFPLLFPPPLDFHSSYESPPANPQPYTQLFEPFFLLGLLHRRNFPPIKIHIVAAPPPEVRAFSPLYSPPPLKLWVD